LAANILASINASKKKSFV